MSPSHQQATLWQERERARARRAAMSMDRQQATLQRVRERARDRRAAMSTDRQQATLQRVRERARATCVWLQIPHSCSPHNAPIVTLT